MTDLTRIDGIGKATAKKLAAAGIDSFEKLARFAEFPDLAETVEVKAEWVEQAKRLSDAEEEQAASDADGNIEPAGADDQPETAKAAEDQEGTDGDGDAGGEAAAGEVNSTDSSASEDHGTGDAAGPEAGGETAETDASIAGGAEAEAEQQARLREAAENRFVFPAGMSREEFANAYPLTDEAIAGWHHSDPQIGRQPLVRISALPRTGFRRAGLAHSHEPVDHEIGKFTVEQMEMLLGEPRLKVELV